jgi:thiol-disulfide isomerase/thioredoxin
LVAQVRHVFRVLKRGVLFLCVALGCRSSSSTSQHESAPAASAPAKLRTLAAPPGESALTLVQREAARERAEGRTLLIYVGATWCEPCQRFHAAAASGQLDVQFPKLSLLEFDRDRDEARLAEAGCLSQFIPLFAVPDASGHCSARQVQGSIKGDGAVAEITPRLRQLLE